MAEGGTAARSSEGEPHAPSDAGGVRRARNPPAGYTIYWFARDHLGSPRSACTGRCLLVWLPVTGHPVAAKGVTLDAVLGTITRPDGVVQATYDGYLLYTFGDDSAPGQAHGNGAVGVWHVIPEKAPAS
jgi:predicted lipoprotein with Yx(FWY)xxD motif